MGRRSSGNFAPRVLWEKPKTIVELYALDVPESDGLDILGKYYDIIK